MKEKPAEPPVPQEARETLRRALEAALGRGPCSARDLSGELGIPEREVPDHLEHVRKTVAKAGGHLVITPAECRKCGFVFTKRERFRKPGKCPVCKGTSIREPLFSLE